MNHDQEDTENAEQIADDDDHEEEEDDQEENEREIERQGQEVLEFAKARFRQLIKGTLEHYAAQRRKKKRRKRGAGGATAIHAFADVAELSMEEQIRMQIACLTQSHFDCATRAAGELPPDDAEDDSGDRFARRIPPPDAQRSYRMNELRSQSHLALATARLVETVQRGQGTQMRHAFTYEHLHRHNVTQGSHNTGGSCGQGGCDHRAGLRGHRPDARNRHPSPSPSSV